MNVAALKLSHPAQTGVASPSPARSSRAAKVAVLAALLMLCTMLAWRPALAQDTAIIDLGKGVLDGVTSVQSGEEFEFALSYSCSSVNVACINAKIVDTLPAGIELLDVVSTNHVDHWTLDGSVVTFYFKNPLPGGSSGIIRLQVKFHPGLIPGDPGVETMPVTNHATMTADNASTKSAVASITLEPGNFQMFAQKDQLNEAVVGEPLTFSLELCSPTNIGGVSLTDPTFTDVLPEGATFVTATVAGLNPPDFTYDAGTNSVVWDNLPSPWPVGSCLTRQITIVYNELPPDTSTFTNTLEVTGIPHGCEPGSPTPLPGYCAQPDPTVVLTDTNSFHLSEPFGRWGIDKSAHSTSSFLGSEAIRGEQISYSMVVSNSGFLTMTNVVFTDTLPGPQAGFTYGTTRFDQITFGPFTGSSSISGWYRLRGSDDLIPLSIEPFTSTVTLTRGDLALPDDVDIELFRWEADGLIPPGARWTSSMLATVRYDTNTNQYVTNCINLSATTIDASEFPPTFSPIEAGDCADTEIIEARAIPRITKERTSATSGEPGSVVSYQVKVYNDPAANLDVIGPVMVDLLPPELEYITGTLSVDSAIPLTQSLPITLEAIPNYSGSGQTLLRAIWDPAATMAPGASVTLAYQAMIQDGTPPGLLNNTANLLTNTPPGVTLGCEADRSYTDSLDLDGDGDPIETGCRDTAAVTVDVQLSVDTRKQVRGQLDTTWSDYTRIPQGSYFDYRVVLTNTSNVSLTNISFVDILPWAGDTGVIDPSHRGSDFTPFPLSRLFAPDVPFTAYYSASSNPCRPDLVPSLVPPACEPPLWSTNFPLNQAGQPDRTLVRSIRLNLCSGDINNDPLRPTGCYELPRYQPFVWVWRMVIPNGTVGSEDCESDPVGPNCMEAWNSFAFRATGGGLPFRPSEPPKVGVAVTPGIPFLIGDFVWLDVTSVPNDGIQGPNEPGINGVEVLLLNDDMSSILARTFTGPDAYGRDGYYQILAPAGEVGDRFRVAFGVFDVLRPVPPLQGSNPLSDSNGITVTSILTAPGQYIVTNVITVTPGITIDLSIDQGFWAPLDFGDAPQGMIDGTTYNYATQWSTAGNPASAARHIISRIPGVTMQLGAATDDEPDGQPSLGANLDDINGGIFYTYTTPTDDEDGVRFLASIPSANGPIGILTRGVANTLALSATIAISIPNVSAYLNGWIDYDHSWSWSNASPEHVITNQILTNGPGSTIFTVPAAASLGQTWARFRLGSTPDLNSSGTELYGEVEDYSVQIVDPPLKQIVATSEASTPEKTTDYGNGTNVAIGEVVRYRLTAQLPRGNLTNFRMVDALPIGVQYLGNVSVILTATTPSSITIANNPPVVSLAANNAPGVDPTFTFGNITNNSTGPGVEYISVEFNAVVVNTNANQDTLSATSANVRNNFTVYYNDYSQVSNNIYLTIVEPALTQSKTLVAAASLIDAGDPVTYTITTAAGTGARRTTAFDVVISDTVDGLLNFDLSSIEIQTTGTLTNLQNSSAGRQILITVGAMSPGSTVTVKYRTTVANDAPAGSVIPNTSWAYWTSLPGPNGTTSNPTGSATPGTSGSQTGERIGNPYSTLNNYRVSANAPLGLAQGALAKLQPDNPWTIGQHLTFTLVITTPEGLLNNLVVTDLLPSGLAIVSQQVITSAAASGGILSQNYPGTLTLAPPDTSAGDGNDVVWSFGDVLNPADNNVNNNRFLIRLEVVVLNVLSNQDGVTLYNSAVMRYMSASGPITLTAGPVEVDIVEPVLAITKSAAQLPNADAGDPVTYTVILRHAPGSTIPAYDVVLTDTLPFSLRNVTYANVQYTGGPLPWGYDGQTLRVPDTGALPVFGTTDVITVTYSTSFADDIYPGVPITNTAGAVWASLPSGNPERRYDGVGHPDRLNLLNSGALNDYEVNATAVVTPSSADGITKSLIATSASHTTGSSLTIGEIATYALRVTLSEGTWHNLVITDVIPVGLSYLPGYVLTDTTGFSGTLSPATVTATGGSGAPLVVSFATVDVFGDNVTGNNAFTVTFEAIVLDVRTNIGLPGNQTTLVNRASLKADFVPVVESNPVSIVVVEPRLIITKVISPTIAPPQSIVDVTLVVSNTGLSTAFETRAIDFVPAGLAYVPGTLTEVVSNGAAAALLSDSYPPHLQATYSVFPSSTQSVLTFQATIDAGVAPGTVITNTAKVQDASTLPGDNSWARIEPSDYDQAPVEVVTHDLVLQKSSGSGEYRAGEPLTYTITITNVGRATAPGVTITDTVPTSTTFLATGSTPGWNRLPGAVNPCATGDPAGITCAINVGDIAPNQVVTVLFVVRVDAPLSFPPPEIVNAACASDDGSLGPEPTPANNCDDDHTNFLRAQLGDRVWVDANGDGIQEPGEANYAGMVINLYHAGDSAPISTTVSAADGSYYFLNLIPGDYQVEFVPPQTPLGVLDPRLTLQHQGSDPELDSDANQVTGMTEAITLAASEINNSIDAGVYYLSALGDRVWNDLNANGLQDPGEPGIPNVELQLISGNSVVMTTTTNPAGYYLFSDLDFGSWSVRIVVPAGWYQSPAKVGQDNTVDSDFSLTTQETEVVVITTTIDDRDLDAGLYKLTAVGDFVWKDLNANGIQDSGEPGIPGAIVTLLSGPSVATPITTTTSITGGYLFAGLIPGAYILHFQQPPLLFPSPQYQGNDPALDSNPAPWSGLTDPVTLTSGQLDATIDAGFFPGSSIGDFAWNDLNANGIQDAGEPGLPGVTVRLQTVQQPGISSATPSAVAAVDVTTATNASGLYLFTDLQPGVYVAQFTAPAGWLSSPQHVGTNPDVDSDANPTTGLTQNIVLPPVTVDRSIDAGYYQTGAIGSYAWIDVNDDGIRQPTEPPFPNMPVFLYREGESQSFRSTTTDAQGNFLFSDVMPGRYRLRFELIGGYKFTTRNATSDPMANSNADPSTGFTDVFPLISGQVDLTWGAGVLAPTVDPIPDEPLNNKTLLPLIHK